MEDGDADVAGGVDCGGRGGLVRVFGVEIGPPVGTYCLDGIWVIGKSFLEGGGGIRGGK